MRSSFSLILFYIWYLWSLWKLVFVEQKTLWLPTELCTCGTAFPPYSRAACTSGGVVWSPPSPTQWDDTTIGWALSILSFLRHCEFWFWVYLWSPWRRTVSHKRLGYFKIHPENLKKCLKRSKLFFPTRTDAESKAENFPVVTTGDKQALCVVEDAALRVGVSAPPTWLTTSLSHINNVNYFCHYLFHLSSNWSSCVFLTCSRQIVQYIILFFKKDLFKKVCAVNWMFLLQGFVFPFRILLCFQGWSFGTGQPHTGRCSSDMIRAMSYFSETTWHWWKFKRVHWL